MTFWIIVISIDKEVLDFKFNQLIDKVKKIIKL